MYYGVEFFMMIALSHSSSQSYKTHRRMGVSNNKYIVDEMALKAGL